jgi:hypothetical protein
MALIISGANKELAELYSGYDSAKVGAGLLQPDVYKTPAYNKKKVKTILLGTLAEISYGGAEHDQSPLILPFLVETQYNTLLAFNLHYVPYTVRRNILKVILDMNYARIKSNLPIIVDYHSVVKVVPQAQYIVRRYKQVLVSLGSNGGSIPLSEWDKVIKGTSKWQGHWKMIKEGKV